MGVDLYVRAKIQTFYHWSITLGRDLYLTLPYKSTACFVEIFSDLQGRLIHLMAQSARAEEYTDCIYAEE